MQELLADIHTRLKEAVEKVHVPPWPLEATSASQRATATQARRFGKAVRLLRNIAAFEGTLSRSALTPLVLEQLVDIQVLPFLRRAVGSPKVVLERVERVVEAVPGAWFPAGGPVPKGAQGLLQLLADVGRGLQAGQCGKDEDPHDLSRRLVKLLRKLGSKERADRLSSALKL